MTIAYVLLGILSALFSVCHKSSIPENPNPCYFSKYYKCQSDKVSKNFRMGLQAVLVANNNSLYSVFIMERPQNLTILIGNKSPTSIESSIKECLL